MVNVLKAGGAVEPFSKDKIINSLSRTGISPNQQEKVISELEPQLYENIPTEEVYKHVSKSLQEESHFLKLKYSLKRAIMELGPTGYPFEDFVAEVLKTQGYVTQTGSVLMGNCVNHEIDVIAEKDNQKIMIEAKFHNAPGIHTDLHVTLYTKARFDDLKEKYAFSKPCLYTNTKITPDALAYADCVGMDVVSWNYPQELGLRNLVEKYRLYPVTILPSLSLIDKQTLLESHIILVDEIVRNSGCLDILGIEPDKKAKIIEEAKQILR